MNPLSRLKIVLPLLCLAMGASPSPAQVATVNAANPPNITVLYDGGPYLYPPNTPTSPTTIYSNDILVPTATSSTLTIELDALLDAGLIEGTAGNLDGAYTAQEPAVVTSNPDTYSLSPATVYYTPPASQPPAVATANTGPFYFEFGTQTSPVVSGYTKVSEITGYDPTVGYGWGDTSLVTSRDRGVTGEPLGSTFCIPTGTPFYVDLANGNYTVSVLSGDAAEKSSMSVRANGLLELYSMGAPTGNYLQQSFPITVTEGRIRLEFFGSICHVNAITIAPNTAPHQPTIFVASDSTAAAYTQYQYPLTGWGSRLANFLTADVAVDDQAKAGRSSKSFIEEGALDTIVNRIQPGDYLFVMMAINDGAKDAPRHTDPATTFKAYLRVYVNTARAHGAYPVFVTSQTKNTSDLWGRFYNSVGAYPQSMRDLGAELKVPVIDLNQMSIDYFTSVGPNQTKNLFMYLAPGQWANWPNGDSDYIHFQDAGATALARLVVNAIQQENLPGLAQFVIGPPFIAEQPQDQTVTVGDNATLAVTATGTPALTYQWLFNGNPISGATGAAYTVANAQLADAGAYSVIVTNATGQSLASSAAQLTVNVNAVFSGRATVYNGTTSATGSTTVSDTGSLPGAGGALSTSVLTIGHPGSGGDIGHASTIGRADRTLSEASIADLALNAGSVTVGADFVMAHSAAVWQPYGTAISGSAEVDGLTINGVAIAVTGQANQTIPLLNGQLTINEQIPSSTGLTVNALHLSIPGVVDQIISSAQAGLASIKPPPSAPLDYVTGGGWISGTPSGSKGTFGIDGGIDGSDHLWGDLSYHDHGSNLQVQSTVITTYQTGAAPNDRHIEGTAQINGQGGFTFSVDVADNSGSGTPDTFSIALSTGYQATGPLGGGHIQLHQPSQ